MCCFPRFKVGVRESYTHKREAEKSSILDGQGFDKLKDAVTSSAWSLAECSTGNIAAIEDTCKDKYINTLRMYTYLIQ